MMSDPVHAKVRRATRMLVAFGRQSGRDDEEIRTFVLNAIKEALNGNRPWKRMRSVPGEPEPLECVTAAGFYRLILEYFGLDRSDLYLQETWLVWVQRALAEALAETDGDFQRLVK